MNVKRTFIPGDQWLYYKLYCGARTADSILAEIIRPLMAHLLQENYISHWFFIRYNDPEFHLRIRVYLKDTSHVGKVVLEMNTALQYHVENEMIYKVQTATYQREIERYGATTIELSETLFYHESTMLLEAIANIIDEKLYFLFILKAIDHLLTDFGYDIKEKLQLVSGNGAGFKKEFQAGKQLNRQLDKKYRNLKTELSAFLSTSATVEYALLETLLKDKSSKTSPIIKTIIAHKENKLLEVAWERLISSYIHMLVNRAFRSRQRFYELVCYDFLKRYYATVFNTTKNLNA